MNKKIITMTAALLATLMLASCTGGSNDTNDTTAGDTTTAAPTTTVAPETEAAAPAYKDAADLLSAIWNAMPEDQRFMIGGGNTYNFETVTQNAPGKFVATADTDYDALLGFPAADVAKIDDAASMFHMMNQNTYTAAAFHFTNTDDVAGMVETLRKNIQGRQWMCGFPEKLVILTAGDYVITMWGAGELVDPITAKALETVEGSVKAVDEPVL